MNMRKLNKLRNKAYRDAYVSAHVQQGLAYQIRALRESRGWDQKELAEKIGLKSQSAIARLEDPSYGKLSISTVQKLTRAFDVAVLLKFVPYSRLLAETENVTTETLTVPSFEEELPALERTLVTVHTSKAFGGVSSFSAARPSVGGTSYPRPTVAAGAPAIGTRIRNITSGAGHAQYH